MQGDCLLFYNPSDIEKLEKFMKDKPVAEQEIGSLLIAETAAFAESSHCRRKLLLHLRKWKKTKKINNQKKISKHE